MTNKLVREYLARIGRKGGEATGESKRRGDSVHYRQIARKRWARQRARRP